MRFSMKLGADYLIEGGQTMNPSTEDVLQAISHVNAKNIFIFPNDQKYYSGCKSGKRFDRR